MGQPQDMESAPAQRRAPVQARSRERFERMLRAATDIIAELGSDAMRMSEVAARAGVPIGSLYQFFPDKAAIVRTLAERYNAESRKCIEEGLKGVSGLSSLGEAFSRLLDMYYGLFLDEPAMRDVWAAMQADKSLRAVQLEESRKNAALLVAVLERIMPKGSHPELTTRALVVMHLGEEAMRLAVSVDREEGGRILQAYKIMAVRELTAARQE